MNLGDKLKQLRTDKNWTQPQAAEAIGIEQSYLSKLENEKSVPSADIFQAILKAYNIDTAKFLTDIDTQYIDRQLRQIPEVVNYLNALNLQKNHSIKKWLFSSAIACVIGLTLIAAGSKALLFSNDVYEYHSPGIVLTGESKDIFRNWEDAFNVSRQLTDEELKARELKMLTMIQRRNEDIVISGFQGEKFNHIVEGGSRTYYLQKIQSIETPLNRYLILIGVLLVVSGLFGFVVEYRLRKIF